MGTVVKYDIVLSGKVVVKYDIVLSGKVVVKYDIVLSGKVQLLNTISSYLAGCEFLKRNIITLLLELYSMKQISDKPFIETCLKL